MSFFGDKNREGQEKKAIQKAYEDLTPEEQQVVDEAVKAAQNMTGPNGQKIKGIGEDTALGLVARLGAFLAQGGKE